MWLWLITLLKGFLPIDGKRIGKIIWVLVLCAVAIGIYHKAFVQKTTKIEKIENYYACPENNKVVGVTANLWKFKLSLGF
jgi:hypothetical protein